jgi:superfamily I DNA and/or RNA helicase/very-short-patch-repair endonuclease
MNLEFLKRLKQKLQIGNTRSIHLNAIPGRLATRLDAYDLNNVQDNLADKFLQSLFTQSKFNFRFKITTDHVSNEQRIKIGMVSKRITSTLYENEDNFLEHGIKTFGFGFPILVYKPKSDPEKLICAPVFIWKLELKCIQNEWTISRDEDYSISMNEVMFNYLEQDLNTKGFTRLSEEYLSDYKIDKDELIELTKNLLFEISGKNMELEFDGKVIALENRDKLKAQFETRTNPYISFSGVFGLYRSQKEAVIQDLNLLIDNFDELNLDNLKVEKYQTTPFTAVPTDPTQTRALKQLSRENKLIIHGPPGTGKSQSLTGIIVNALANKAKCLVVCEKKTALEVIKKNLEKIGLGELCGLVEDVNRDRRNIIYSVRGRDLSEKNYSSYSPELLISEACNKIQNINNGHKFYGKVLLQDYTWTDLVGKYLSFSRQTELTQKIYLSLKNDGFDFTRDILQETYDTLSKIISTNFHLFEETKDKIQIFAILKDDLFSKSTSEVVINIRSFIDNMINYIAGCIIDGNGLLNKYETALRQHLDEYYQFSLELIKKCNDIYVKDIVINKKLFLCETALQNYLLSTLALFSAKYKSLKKDRVTFLSVYDQILQQPNYDYHALILYGDKIDLEHKNNALNSYRDNLINWYAQSNSYIKNIIEHLNSSNVNSRINFNRGELDSFNEKCNTLLSNLNDSEFFITKFDLNIETILGTIEKLKEIKEFLENILINLPDLFQYAEWKNHYNNLPDNQKKVIDILRITESTNWIIDFEAWFIFNILLNKEVNISLRNEIEIKSLKESLEKIGKWQIQTILVYWRGEQDWSRAKFNSKHSYNVNILFNLSRNNRFFKKNALRSIINKDFILFTDYFPVLLVNPAVCSSLFRMQEGLFDLVIFDEASQLRIEDVYAAKLRGKVRIVSGDENQMPPSNTFLPYLVQLESTDIEDEDDNAGLKNIFSSLADSESLLEYAIRRGYKETYLDIHYRSKHPDLIEFSNCAFYGSRLKPLPPRVDYKAFSYFNLGGIYNQSEGINEMEAEKVIDIINDVVDLKEGRIPSIGVATLNIFQRNHILDLIKSRCDSDSNFARKIELLVAKKGEELFVKNLENIQGDERDIVIISTTFGLREDGSFIQNYGPINNSEKGYRLLNVIVTRAKQKVFVCTSIPESYINSFQRLLENKANKGSGVFYAYLAYAKAIEEDNIEMKNSILNLLAKNCEVFYPSEFNLTESIFEQEVYDLLCQHIEPSRIETQYRLGGFRIDIVVKSANNNTPLIAIECDGAKYHSSEEAYAWDIFRQQFLEEYGLKFIRIWSANWWNNPARELKRVLTFINEVDASQK